MSSLGYFLLRLDGPQCRGSLSLTVMANYSGYGRTNYVVLCDEQAYETFIALVLLLGGTTEERTDEQGVRSIAAFGNDEDGDFKNTLYVSELVESGYVSPWEESELDATRADYLAIVADDAQQNGEFVEIDGIDFLSEAYGLLAPGQVLVFMTVGHEKLRYVNGAAVAINEEGKTVSLALDDIYKIAEKAFNTPVTTAAY